MLMQGERGWPFNFTPSVIMQKRSPQNTVRLSENIENGGETMILLPTQNFNLDPSFARGLLRQAIPDALESLFWSHSTFLT